MKRRSPLSLILFPSPTPQSLSHVRRTSGASSVIEIRSRQLKDLQVIVCISDVVAVEALSRSFDGLRRIQELLPLSESNNNVVILPQFHILLRSSRFVVDALFFLQMKNKDGEDVATTLTVVAVDVNGERTLKVTRRR
ncbi:unnamed protein product [Vicia faba]|uniref:Uncharacterized protein n=1 Tax=Vicia faba TaxID=3906 RepID=A0AAV0ZWX8_VICFA|nr:unnamed protein product [Vicia faba]